MRVNRSFLTGVILGAIAAGTAVYFLVNRRPATRPLELIQWRPAEHIIPDSFLSAHQAGLLGNLLDLIDADLRDDPQRTLTPETIDRIAVFCYGARPYLAVETDSLGTLPYSPERGQLLLVLARMNMDSMSWQRIKQKATFGRAYLPNADLTGADLQGVDLRGAFLRDARLQGATAIDANLTDANLRGADLRGAVLRDAQLKRADLRWIDLNGADLRQAVLAGADLSSSNLDKANMRHADLQWADARNARLRGADLTHANISGISLHKAILDSVILDSANLMNARLLETTLSGASLRGANLERVVVADPEWFAQLQRWNVAGADSLHLLYRPVSGKSKGHTGYRLDKIPK